MGSTWILIRHGRTERNRRRLLCGQDDVPLDYEGRWQAIRLGLTLRGQAPPPLLLCSDQARAIETAAALASAAGWPLPSQGGWQLEPELRERALGQWEGRSYEELRRTDQSARLIGWSDRPPGGESLRGLARRLLASLARLPEGPGLLVSHAGPIRVLVGLAENLPLDRIGTQHIPHASPIPVALPPGGWRTLIGRISD
jgi:broad specificity phosphatase PhoE